MWHYTLLRYTLLNEIIYLLMYSYIAWVTTSIEYTILYTVYTKFYFVGTNVCVILLSVANGGV